MALLNNDERRKKRPGRCSRTIRRLGIGARLYYVMRPKECWAYAVTQYLAESEPWVAAFVTGQSPEACGMRAFAAGFVPKELLPLPFRDPKDFETIRPVIAQSLGLAPEIDLD